MTRSLGDLVDRLSVTNIKLWFVMDQVHAAARAEAGLDAETTSRLVSLNLERNVLMSEIDETLDHAARKGRARIEARIKLT